MAMEIFKLVGSIFVDNTEANNSIAKTDEKASNVGQTLLSGVKTAAKWGTAIVGGATAAVSGVTALATNAASTADNIDKMSQKIGISREAYQEWDYIMSQNGMDVDKLQVGVKTLTNKMADAAEGGASSSEAFAKLGLSVTDTEGKMKSQEQMLSETITALQNMDNETERAALASELLGKSGTEIAPLLNSGAESVENLRNKAHELGMIIDDETVDAGVNLTDTMDTLKRSFSAIVTKLSGTVMPVVEKVSQYIIDNLPKIEGLFKKLEPVITMVFESLMPPLMSLAETLIPIIIDLIATLIPPISQIIEAILPVIVQLLQMLLPPFVQIVQALLPPLLAMLQPLLNLLSPILNLLTPILSLVTSLLTPLANLITGLLTPIISVISTIVEKCLGPLQNHLQIVANVLSGTLSAAIEWIMNEFDTLKGVFNGFLEFFKGVFTGDWERAWNGIKDIFSSIWEGIKEAFKIPINWIIDGINSFIEGINAIQIPDWVPGVGGKGLSIDLIPRLAKGGVLEKGEMGLLEGTGAEAVVPLENNRKWISAVADDMEAGGIGGGKNGEMLAEILRYLETIVKMGIYIDGDKLVGAIASPMDKKLGELAVRKARA